ncbi:MAG: NYN domain-containing protein [Caldiserica bacterium]|nr:NYN domain-containing protein [Caldisericota bacterium]
MLIVDGYNLLHQLPRLKGKKIDRARDIMVRKLGEKRRTFQEMIVVFDGEEGPVPARFREKGIKVIFSGEESADDYIKRQVKRSKTPHKITVVTDDREIRDFVKLHGSKLLSTKEMKEILFPEKTPVPPPAEEKPSPSSEKGRKINAELRKVWRA